MSVNVSVIAECERDNSLYKNTTMPAHNKWPHVMITFRLLGCLFISMSLLESAESEIPMSQSQELVQQLESLAEQLAYHDGALLL